MDLLLPILASLNCFQSLTRTIIYLENKFCLTQIYLIQKFLTKFFYLNKKLIKVFHSNLVSSGKVWLKYTCELSYYCTGQDEDYTSGPYSVTFIAGMTTASLSVPIKDDYVFEDIEAFRLLIDLTSLPNDVILVNPRVSTMVIMDDDGKSII